MSNSEKFHFSQNDSIKNGKRKSNIVLIFVLIWFMSFIGGCTTKLIYQFNNDSPDWLNSIVVGTFLGIAFCSMSLVAISAFFVNKWNSKSAKEKLTSIYALILGTLFFLASLAVFWTVVKNLLVLIS